MIRLKSTYIEIALIMNYKITYRAVAGVCMFSYSTSRMLGILGTNKRSICSFIAAIPDVMFPDTRADYEKSPDNPAHLRCVPADDAFKPLFQFPAKNPAIIGERFTFSQGKDETAAKVKGDILQLLKAEKEQADSAGFATLVVAGTDLGEPYRIKAEEKVARYLHGTPTIHDRVQTRSGHIGVYAQDAYGSHYGTPSASADHALARHVSIIYEQGLHTVLYIFKLDLKKFPTLLEKMQEVAKHPREYKMLTKDSPLTEGAALNCAKYVQMVFGVDLNTLSPLKTAHGIVADFIHKHPKASRQEKEEAFLMLLEPMQMARGFHEIASAEIDARTHGIPEASPEELSVIRKLYPPPVLEDVPKDAVEDAPVVVSKDTVEDTPVDLSSSTPRGPGQ